MAPRDCVSRMINDRIPTPIRAESRKNFTRSTVATPAASPNGNSVSAARSLLFANTKFHATRPSVLQWQMYWL